MEHLINGERAYPIYRFTAKWSQDGVQDPQYPNWHKGLPVGRVWDSSSWFQMYKEEQPQELLDAEIKEWFEEYKIKKGNMGIHGERQINNPADVELRVEFVEYETWVGTHFQHQTFDIGQSDGEALASFERFVQRKEVLNRNYRGEYGEGAYCLMGAQDRWRWHGAEPSGEPKDHSNPPCRCPGCKKLGLIRIAH